MLEPVIAKTDAEISRCFPIVAELRPHLDEASFVAMVRGMETQGFRADRFYLRQGMDIASFHFSEKLDRL